MNPQSYYEEHKDYLSEKLKDQYDIDKSDKIILVFFAVLIVIVLIVG